MTPQAVIFDIGNVLIGWQPERFYDSVMGPERRQAMFDAVDLHAMNDAIDKGAPFRETVYRTAEDHPEFAPFIRMWHDRWAELAGPVIDHSVHLLRMLRRKGVPVFTLTNFGRGSFAYAEVIFPILREFDRRYVSGHLGVIKPDPAIYEAVEADCGVPPAALLFADDRADNVAAAEARGWQGHLFDGPEGWAARLVSAGLLTEAEIRPAPARDGEG